MKEIHFYTNLCNEEQISDKDITNVLVDFVSSDRAINDSSISIVRTTQLSLLINAWDYIGKGYKVLIHNDNWCIEVKEHMDIPNVPREYTRDIRRGHRIDRLLYGGTFGKLK